MRELIDAIMTATDSDLQQLMEAIEQRYSTVHPDWDVVYIAVHKDPVLRAQDFSNILAYMKKDLTICKENDLP